MNPTGEIRYIEVTDVDIQRCTVQLNEKISKQNIDNRDIISIQRQWNDKPSKMDIGRGHEEGNVTLFVFFRYENNIVGSLKE